MTESFPVLEEYKWVCPYCEKTFPGVEHMEIGADEEFPNPDADDGKGRIVICDGCCKWSVFFSEPSGRVNVRKATYDELLDMMSDPAVVHSTLKALVIKAINDG